MTFPAGIVVNDLAEFQFIAGTKQTLTFDILDSTGSALNLNGASCTWQLSQYGQSNSQLAKTASVSGSPINRMIVTLASADTQNLSGRYVHQPVIVDFSGNEYRPSQGLIFVQPRII